MEKITISSFALVASDISARLRDGYGPNCKYIHISCAEADEASLRTILEFIQERKREDGSFNAHVRLSIEDRKCTCYAGIVPIIRELGRGFFTFGPWETNGKILAAMCKFMNEDAAQAISTHFTDVKGIEALWIDTTFENEEARGYIQTLFLRLLPTLKQVRIGSDIQRELALDTSNHSPAKLEDLQIKFSKTSTNLEVTTWLTVALMNKVRKIEFLGLHDLGPNNMEVIPILDHVQELAFRNCYLDAGTMRNLVRALAKMKSLTKLTLSDISKDAESYEIVTSEIKDGFKSMRELNLSFHPFDSTAAKNSILDMKLRVPTLYIVNIPDPGRKVEESPSSMKRMRPDVGMMKAASSTSTSSGFTPGQGRRKLSFSSNASSDSKTRVDAEGDRPPEPTPPEGETEGAPKRKIRLEDEGDEEDEAEN